MVFDRYSLRAEQSRLPHGNKARETLASQVAEDGFLLLKLLIEQQPDLLELENVETLRKVWHQHYTRGEKGGVRWRVGKETFRAAASIESPYDIEARYSRKDVTKWTGYKVHFSETCDAHLPHLITNVHTTPATGSQFIARNIVLKTSTENNTGTIHKIRTEFQGTNVEPISGQITIKTAPDEYLEVIPNSGTIYNYAGDESGRILKGNLQLGNNDYFIGDLLPGFETDLFIRFVVEVKKR